MNCEQVRKWFSDYLDGQSMPVWPRMFVWLHLRMCPRCRRVHRSMQATGDALSALKDQPPHPGA